MLMMWVEWSLDAFHSVFSYSRLTYPLPFFNGISYNSNKRSAIGLAGGNPNKGSLDVLFTRTGSA
jgi:hypothetical protein